MYEKIKKYIKRVLSETSCWYSKNQREDGYELMEEYSLIKHDDWHLEECLKGSNKQKQMNIKPNEKKTKPNYESC